MSVKIEVSADDNAVGEWLAALTVMLAWAAFALLLYHGSPPAMDGVGLETRSSGPERAAVAGQAPTARTLAPPRSQ